MPSLSGAGSAGTRIPEKAAAATAKVPASTASAQPLPEATTTNPARPAPHIHAAF